MSDTAPPPSTQPGNGNAGAPPPSHDEAWISDLVDSLVPKFQAAGSTSAGDSAMRTDDEGPARAEESQVRSELDDPMRLDPEFVVNQARNERNQAGKAADDRRAGRRAKGIAQKGVLAEHYDKFSRSIQVFIKFFLGNPEKPQTFPHAPTESELAAQYWVENRGKVILQQLDRVRASLSNKPAAEVEYYIGVAEKEIRQNIKSPPFVAAASQGPVKGSIPISPSEKADVERALALAGISRVTFVWEAIQTGDPSAWNSTIVDVLASKAVEWIRRKTPVKDDQASQAPAIIQRWLQTKSRELRECQNMDPDTYDRLKKQKASKDQHQRWRKRILLKRCSMVDHLFPKNIQLAHIVEQKDCGSDIEDAGDNVAPVSLIPDWRSDDLTAILHCLDKMTIARGEHHKTIAANEKLYARSKKNFKSTKGIIGVPRSLPLDAYSKLYWSRISPYERDTISKVPAIGLNVIAQNLQEACKPGSLATGSTSSAPTTSNASNGAAGGSTGGQSHLAAGGSMHMDH
ncbi:hypothetical protein PTTG_10105 [Puccinia triticina 1-1 BBBD Race 1]|uniref:Uncharacterized protein n=1 Tax=Puccinia triticina (isolate 1-1 / race 1 (BBBD)) TaxID=630390 RepID=A0A180GQB2_PUCT1|nr:hypothetical protein PTTG_10105 [Puccinia triticina 1-1 BBBD Race 1]